MARLQIIIKFVSKLSFELIDPRQAFMFFFRHLKNRFFFQSQLKCRLTDVSQLCQKSVKLLGRFFKNDENACLIMQTVIFQSFVYNENT